MGVSQRQFAATLGWTTARLLDLAKVLGTAPEVWMNLQMTWDLRRAEMRRRAS